MLIVMREVLPRLPNSERFDLKDQLSRSCKAIPRLIAEGYAKRHQKAGFQKYLDEPALPEYVRFGIPAAAFVTHWTPLVEVLQGV